MKSPLRSTGAEYKRRACLLRLARVAKKLAAQVAYPPNHCGMWTQGSSWYSHCRSGGLIPDFRVRRF
jgi:hypothetical protein